MKAIHFLIISLFSMFTFASEQTPLPKYFQCNVAALIYQSPNQPDEVAKAEKINFSIHPEKSAVGMINVDGMILINLDQSWQNGPQDCLGKNTIEMNNGQLTEMSIAQNCSILLSPRGEEHGTISVNFDGQTGQLATHMQSDGNPKNFSTIINFGGCTLL